MRYVGASNYSAAQLDQALRVADEQGLARFVSLRPHHNLVYRSEFEGDLEALCERERLAVIPYSPLQGGFLTGKYRRDAPLPDSRRAGHMKKYMTDQGFAVIDALEEVAAAHGTTMPAVALAWQLARPSVVAPIIGANTPDQLADLLPASDLTLTDDEIARLNDVSAGL